MERCQSREFVLTNLYLWTLRSLLRVSGDGGIACFILESLGIWVPCVFPWPDAGRKVKLVICRNLLELGIGLAALHQHREGRAQVKVNV